MKKIIVLLLLLTFQLISAQSKGTVRGVLTDKEMNNEPLSFANVLIKGTTIGITTEMDGSYELKLEPGSYTIVFSFLGYKTVEVPFTLQAGQTKTINRLMEASEGVALEEIKIKATVGKESESALLIEQKKAVNIKESIGTQQLEKLGVSNVSAATTKIAGVSKSDGAGQIYVRGLGDRYLTTTLNGLPIPSDNIDKKNIDLGLFPTRFIENVSISKTFSPDNSSDQASGNIDIISKTINKRKEFALSFSNGINTNAGDVFGDFKATAVNRDISFGFFSKPYQNNNLQSALVNQSWNPQTIDAPLNYSFGFNAGGFLDEEGKFRLYFSGGQSVNHEYREGEFRSFDQGQLNDIVPDNDNRFWRRTVNTSGILTSQYKINKNNKLNLNIFSISRVFEEVFEAGREGNTIYFEELSPASTGNQFVRDQNLKSTFLTVTQLLGSHKLSENNNFEWAVGYNMLVANEPNRIRNEVNIMNASSGFPEGLIILANQGDYQQSKRSQEISDNEVNGRFKDAIVLKKDEDDESIYSIKFGGSARYKTRDFASKVDGFDEVIRGSINPASIDNLTEIFTQQNIDNGILRQTSQATDLYDGTLFSYGGFLDFVGVFNQFTAQLGLRYQNDEIDIDYNVLNAPGGRLGSIDKSYQRFYPAVNLKYSFNNKAAIRFAGSLSQTLPEFKEIAPFEYVPPVGQRVSGNPRLEASRNINLDLKFEFFPSSEELLSITTYFKNIKDPINMTIRTGGDGQVMSFFNTGDNARIFGVELEGRLHIIKQQDDSPNLKIGGNLSYVNHKQDLKSNGLNFNGQPRTFQYRGLTKIGLEGASDWTANLAITFNSGKEFPFETTLAANYASDRIFALGATRNQLQSNVFFNGEIIEKGVVVLDFIMRKDISKRLSINASAKNLLNPVIRRYQNVSAEPAVSSAITRQTVLTYTRGVNASVGINYKF